MLKSRKGTLIVLIIALVLGGFMPGAARALAASGSCDLLQWSGTLPLGSSHIETITLDLPAGTVVHYDLNADTEAIFAIQYFADSQILLHESISSTGMSGQFTIAGLGSMFPLPLPGFNQLMVGVLAAAQDATVTLSVTYECGDASAPAWGPACPAVLDGRINADPGQDCAAPVAVFVKRGGYEIYDPAAGAGVPVLAVSYGQIMNAGAPTDQNLLLGEGVLSNGQTVQLYRLTTGEFSLFASYADGKPYVIVWATGADDLYHYE
ncbi:hypothetical protein [Aggregatilinea lenta]|uniref:hypothetical protein n=1 Tax=Aggregatilinea lenta TaxID=913108 RepID=UPI0013C2BC2B|nr:hypothetical protein [Aggregatilinea lenta]